MSPEYPYQLVYFLDKEPEIGETVYSGVNGWYPQLALKRRFKFLHDEKSGLRYVEEFCHQLKSDIRFKTGKLTMDDRMPVKYIEVSDEEDAIVSFHRNLIAFMSNHIESRYPEREDSNYLPHVTAEYDGEVVIEVDSLTDRAFTVERVCILKDVEGNNSIAYKYYQLGEASSRVARQ